MKEATARIKINRLLEAAGWRFFDDAVGAANIQLEPHVKITQHAIDALGEDFERTKHGFVDFLLLDERGFPFIVLEAKAEDKSPLDGKEQARAYAGSQNCRFVLLSNGNLHYFWDLEQGSPYIITSFPTPGSLAERRKLEPSPKRLTGEVVGPDYIARTQRAGYEAEAGWRNEDERPAFIKANRLRFLRPYQLTAIHRLQSAVASGKERFLFEMATGTGKTLIAAAVIKLFLRTGNAARVLFLVDRLELEDQAWKSFDALLATDFTSVIYKENRDDWRRAEIVVTTVQSLLFNNKYQQLFSPTDFDLVISDEAHRSIGGNARAVFEYFAGYKLGLTATPKDFLRNYDDASDPRETERRLWMDTYRTFGCENTDPTFRYSLLDGVRDGYLINPTVIGANTDVTTQLLSERGYVVTVRDDGDDDDDDEHQHRFTIREYEKRFFSDETNMVFCKTFMEHALLDPISNEVGKSIVFAVSQHHASKLTQMLNEIADRMYPGKYASDFAVQVTSNVHDAQQMAINFSNNNLRGSENFVAGYKTSKTRVCVTVGMMTTGYDCTDILNIGLFRPIFSPTDFIQIKGRGTRTHDFRDELHDQTLLASIEKPEKTTFKLFDFFKNYQYFEQEFQYDDVLELPALHSESGGVDTREPHPPITYQHLGNDALSDIKEQVIGYAGMRIDRAFFETFEDKVRSDRVLVRAVEDGRWGEATEHVRREVLDKPEEYYTLERLRRAAAVDRRLGLREILEKALGLIPRFKSKDELLEEEFSKFVADVKPDRAQDIPALKTYFKAYATNGIVRDVIAKKRFQDLATNAAFTTSDYKAVPEQYREAIPAYIQDYVSLDQFTA